MDERVPTRISKHGYPVYERPLNKEVLKDIHTEGLDQALSTHNRLDVLKALGGEEYGAKITKDTVVYTIWFDNPQKLKLKDIEDLIPIMESIKVTFTLTNLLVLQVPSPRLQYSPVMMARVEKIIQLGKPWHKKLSDYESDPDWSASEVNAMRAESRKFDPQNPDRVFEDMTMNAKVLHELEVELTSRGFIRHIV